MISGLNIANEQTEKRSFFVQKIVALALTLGSMLLAAIALAALAVLPVCDRLVSFAGRAEDGARAWAGGRCWPALVAFALAIVYRFGAYKENPKWRWISWGAAIATVLWIFAEIAPNARMAQEEIFGPVLALIKVANFEEGLKVANNTEYGLTGSIYSTDREKLNIARREYHVGNLYFNRKCTGAMVGAHPFGGFNMSGTDSKAGGPDYLLLFTQAKSVAEKL